MIHMYSMYNVEVKGEKWTKFDKVTWNFCDELQNEAKTSSNELR